MEEKQSGVLWAAVWKELCQGREGAVKRPPTIQRGLSDKDNLGLDLLGLTMGNL